MALAFQSQGSSTSVHDPELTRLVSLITDTPEAPSRSYIFSGKGDVIGGKEDTDEELAFRIQSEYLEKALQMIEDARVAKLLDEGAEANHPSLNVIPDTANPTRTHISANERTTRQPSTLSSLADLYTKSVIEFATSGVFGDFLDSPDTSRSSTPVPTSPSSRDEETLPPIHHTDEGTGLKDKGKGKAMSSDPVTNSQPPSSDETPTYNNEDLPGISEDKGKGKEATDDMISDDEKFALKVQADDLQTALQIMEDAQLAKSLDEGAEAKHASLKQPNYTNQVAIALRQAALSVAAKNGLPGPSSLPREPNSSFGSIPLAATDTLPMMNTHEILVSRLLTPEHVSGLGVSSSLLYPYTERPKTPPMLNTVTPKQDDDQTQLPLQTLCIICEDSVTSANATRTPCGHDYCKDCIISYVDASTRDNSLLPVRCCNVPIPQKAVVSFLTDSLLSFYEDKSRELEVPVNHRIYCQSPDCSKFLGSSRRLEGNVTCSECGSSTCATCKQSAHTGESCSENAGTLEVKALARVEHWQTCPGCNTIIELQYGCYHMTCRCATQFCYLCAAKWKTCTCPQSDERHL